LADAGAGSQNIDFLAAGEAARFELAALKGVRLQGEGILGDTGLAADDEEGQATERK
jgi:hypothetical protein